MLSQSDKPCKKTVFGIFYLNYNNLDKKVQIRVTITRLDIGFCKWWNKILTITKLGLQYKLWFLRNFWPLLKYFEVNGYFLKLFFAGLVNVLWSVLVCTMYIMFVVLFYFIFCEHGLEYYNVKPGLYWCFFCFLLCVQQCKCNYGV